ncbi:hypothetical protein ACW95P_04100 [Candidatus Mycoplasma pogonae]
MNLSVKIDFIKYDKNNFAKDTFNMKWSNVPFSQLNHGSQVKALIEIALLFQKQLRVSLPIILDNTESLDETNSKLLIEQYPNVQFITTKVKKWQYIHLVVLVLGIAIY